jgi:hypothetical protein
MDGLCSNVTYAAYAFLWLSFAIAVAETLVAIFGKKAADSRREFAANIEGILDALARVLAALKGLPAWVAIFLAAMALVWTATSAPNLCT